MKKKIIMSTVFGLCLIGADVAAKSDVKFHGTLYKITCVINNDQPVDVSFGNVGINKIDGVQYTQNVTLNITCDDDYNGGMTLYVNGTATQFDNSALQTDQAELGIRIMQDGVPVVLNKPIAVTVEHPPVLTAVPVTLPGNTLEEGTFHGTATLVAEIE